ncbi:hypothetical protein ABT093_03080 [Kitasatospora sp. NPDC002551]|uniref:hypothetical protein n=1 Tax=Kitasatospora sp. NPDC002551 TaxID=3154539 RepID=UPI0033329C44
MTLRLPGAPPPTAAQRPGRRGHRAAVAGLAGAWAVLGCATAPAAASAERSLITVIDNSQADSIVEVDRTADLQIGRGSAGSDHDGATALVSGLLGPGPTLPGPEEGGGE